MLCLNDVWLDVNAGFGRLSNHTLAPNASHAGGYAELDVHNLWGLMEAATTHKALKAVLPGQRPFIISRSAFASSGRWAGHWVRPHVEQFAQAHTYRMVG
jgi:alpha-glucosidase